MTRRLMWLWEPDHFDWITAYLAERNFQGRARAIMVLITALSALAPISTLTHAHASPASNIASVLGTLLATGLTVVWVTWWPARRVSLYCVLVGAVCAAGWSVSQPSAILAALSAMVLAVTGSYIAFFHSAAALVGNSALVVVTTAVVSHRVSQQAGPTTALAVFWLTWLITIALPVGVRGTTHAMRQYAIQSDHDALTGLLNRRGFEAKIGRHLDSRRSRSNIKHLVIMMVDLDNFKRLNDTHGHATGDVTLQRVAGVLTQHAPESAAICRAGGEEFLIAFTTPTDDVSHAAGALCAAIHDSCREITASIGVASADLPKLAHANPHALIEHLVVAADAAMYDAKRNGGNRVHIAYDSTPLDP